MRYLLEKLYFPIFILCLIFAGFSYYAIPKKMKPQDDFYHFANEQWLKDTRIPKDKNMYSTFNILRDSNDKKLASLMQDLIQQPISNQTVDTLNLIHLYKSFLASERLESLALNPLQGVLTEINHIQNPKALLKTMASLYQIGVSLPFSLNVSQDMKQTNQYILILQQSGLGLPDKEYYLSKEASFLTLQKHYIDHISHIFNLAHISNPKQRAHAVFQLEKQLAAAQWSRVDSRDYDKIYNKYNTQALERLTPHIQWHTYLKNFELPLIPQSMIVYQPDALSAFDKLLYTVPLDHWKDYLRWHLLSQYAPYLDHRFVEEDFQFYGKQLGGALENTSREKRAVDLVNTFLSDVVGQLYVKKYFSSESEKQMQTLVSHLKQAFKTSLEQNSWMIEKTKQAALLKLSKLNTKIGYPSQWKTYDGWVFKPDTLVENVMKAYQYEFKRDMQKLNKPVDRNEWHISAQTVNAYYSPNLNEIVFPAAILQPPLFDKEAPAAQNYGSIGAIIGHEISHAFDDQGRKFDGDGNLNNWWTPEDLNNFNRYTQRLIQQYAQYEPIKGAFINGELTLGENIADISGLSIAYRAFKLSTKNEDQYKNSPDNLSPDQLFFISWAKSWKTKIRPEELKRRLIVDPHAPGIYRANGVVKNIDAFYEVFNVKPTDKMYLAPSQRIDLWSFGTG